MCFTAPFSSMKFTKSILRPLRRLRTTGKKRGGAFDTHEPSSPKVTCIGQVRVKSKKRVKQCRRRIGEVSFRTTEQDWIRPQRFSNSGSQSHREQRWVHLPVSVCEALRAFRAEICCFFPCKCSCFRRERNAECGAVFARWLVAVNGGDGGRRREIEVVVGGGDEQRAEMVSVRSSRRHVFEDFEVEDLVGEDEETAARVSICIPPKNALLLMRCRSDPIKMAALENVSGKFDTEEEKYDNDCIQLFCKEESVEEKEEEIEENDEDVGECNTSSFGAVSEETTSLSESAESSERIEIEREEEDDVVQINPERESTIEEEEEEDDVVQINPERESAITIEEKEEEEPVVSTINQDEEEEKPVVPMINEEITKENKSGGGGGGGLPECLLLMMCEPKLSMEVSKETWVRGTDFIRLLPERPRKAANAAVTCGGGDQEPVKKRPSIDSKSSKPRVPAPPSKKNEHQPARSSCSLPVAAVIERNQVNAGKCEAFALTRCKSEPMSTAAAKLMPESC